LGRERTIVLTGDFNCTEVDEPYRILVKPEGNDGVRLIDSYRTVHPQTAPDEATFHGFKGTREGLRIDWILHTPDLKAQEARIIRPATPPYPSDHYPVTAILAPAPR
jgi:endonuclease/exonuclease/phosphatase family metal-dependent hydrolase